MLQQNLSQKLLQKLSPQQIQLMKLLQIPTVSLEERIKEEMEVNPALEDGAYEIGNNDPFSDFGSSPIKDDDSDYEGGESSDTTTSSDDMDFSDYLMDDDTASYKLRDDNYDNSDDDSKSMPIPVLVTFHESLMQQLGMLKLSERSYKIIAQIIGSIDDDGYLRRDLESIVDDLAFGQNTLTDSGEIKNLLAIVQSFDPPGVGARDLQECLLIQLRRKKYGQDSRSVSIAEMILENCFDEFAKKHYDKLLRTLGLTDADLKDAIQEVLKLNPKPGSTYSAALEPENYIIPDFIILNNSGELQLSLNSKNAPDLRISDTYRDMMREYSRTKVKTRQQKEALMFIKQKIDSAKWFIDAIKQRQATMLRTMSAMLSYQHDYFLTGDETRLKPMILKDIADVTGLDISTVSRVANSKYVQTEFGTFKLKSFFSESLQTDSGEEVSTREVKKILSDFMEKENKRKPLSDQKLTEMLMDKGYNIARRTVAKYREQLGVPVARLRKKL
jgi:RNA polymerase sigma-54 factor